MGFAPAILGILSGVVGTLVAGVSPVAAQQPTGSFQRSCRNTQVSGGILTSECRDTRGRYRVSSIPYAQCRGDIGNNDGVLQCSGATAEVGGQPPPDGGRGEGEYGQAAASGSKTISDPVAFLVQARCPNGRLQVAEPDCPARPQQASDPMLERRHDWPAPAGFMAQDALIGPEGPETLWDYAPFRAFSAAKGDGGEVYAVENGTVRITVTQDGGKPYLQGFYGRACGGSGWVAFRTDAPTGRWASLVSRLSDQPVSSPCRTQSTSLTRYRLEMVTAPWIIDGRRRSLTLPTVISEHFNAASIDRASHMERSFFAKGAGRIIWESWSTAAPVGADLEHRCPGSDWSAPPAPGWRLSDCRTATNLVADDGRTTGATYGWPPALPERP